MYVSVILKTKQTRNVNVSMRLFVRFTGFENRITTILGRFSVGFES